MPDTVPSPQAASNAWLGFALLTVAMWGVYGVLLRTGAEGMHDPVNGRFKAFLWVGVAYFIVAILAPLVVLWLRGAGWSVPPGGATWSLIAGVAGAVGAFGVLLAFSSKGVPSTAVVMSIVFAGAPCVNALVTMFAYPPPGGLSSIRWQFVVGMLLAAAGGCLVTLYAPPAPPPKKPAAISPAAAATTPPTPTRS